jgi:hypothetical protein
VKEAVRLVKVTHKLPADCIPQNCKGCKQLKWEITNIKHSAETAGNGARETAHTTSHVCVESSPVAVDGAFMLVMTYKWSCEYAKMHIMRVKCKNDVTITGSEMVEHKGSQ